MIGTQLAHYKILAKLGEGGMGEVYLAEDTRLGRQVALKVLPQEMAADPERLGRFQREARTIAALNHPNIVTIYSVEEIESLHLLTMEHVEGGSLKERIYAGGMPLPQIFDLGIQVADALAAAHERGIVHRDLKPSNVMVTAGGRVKVLDFGLAKLVQPTSASAAELATEALTQAGLVVGTVPYMSPEQVEGRPVDHRTDIFSLGVLLYEMATGKRPFKGDSSPALMSSILRDAPVPLTEIKVELPRHLARIIQHCLEKDPTRRYQSALDVRNELEGLRREIDSGSLAAASASHAAASGSMSATEVAPLPDGAGPRPWPARHRRVLVTATAAAALALAFAWWIGRRSAAPDADAPRRAPHAGRRMMAVLPFDNLGPPEDAYFAAGMTDEITSRLSGIRGLEVISRNSAQRYAGRDLTIEEIGRQLGVDHVLEGTVRWARSPNGPSRVRITPRLVRATDEVQIWSQVFDREIADVFAVQSEIAESVATAIDASLLRGAEGPQAERPTESLEAYDLYLQAKAISQEPSPVDERMQQAADSLEQAILLDPGFAAAHALLSQVHSAFHFYDWDPTEARLVLARQAAERALELEPDLAEGHQSLGIYLYRSARDYEKALRSFQRALELEPNNAEVLHWLGVISKRRGRFEEALDYLRRARRLDPRSANNLVEISINLEFLDRHQEAVDAGDQLMALERGDPDSRLWRALLLLAWTGDTAEWGAALAGRENEPPFVDSYLDLLLFERRYREAIEHLERHPADPAADPSSFTRRQTAAALAHRAIGEQSTARARARQALPILKRLAAENPTFHDDLAVAHALLGERATAVAEGRRAIEAFPPEVDSVLAPDQLYAVARVHALLGEPGAALDRLEQFLAMPRPVSTAYVRADPSWDPIRDHPRFESLLARFDSEA